MYKRKFRLPSPALVISMITLSLVLGGTAFAASTAEAQGCEGGHEVGQEARSETQREAREDCDQRDERPPTRDHRDERDDRDHRRQCDQSRGPAGECLRPEHRRAARHLLPRPGDHRAGVVHRRPALRHRRLRAERGRHHGHGEHRLDCHQLDLLRQYPRADSRHGAKRQPERQQLARARSRAASTASKRSRRAEPRSMGRTRTE